jgi:hypothetical protein
MVLLPLLPVAYAAASVRKERKEEREKKRRKGRGREKGKEIKREHFTNRKKIQGEKETLQQKHPLETLCYKHFFNLRLYKL